MSRIMVPAKDGTFRKQAAGASPPARALEWIRAHESAAGGILVHSGHLSAYPEVSGYLVPTLLACGDRALATRVVRWLIAIQRADGSFAGPDDGLPYVFDTGQVLRGLLSGAALSAGALPAAERAARHLIGRMVDDGRGGFGDRYRGAIQESIHLYVLPPLLEAAGILDMPAWRRAALACLDHYAGAEGTLKIGHLTHFLGYELEALIELGRGDLARPVLWELEALQSPDGALRAKDGARWVCTPGLAQIAISWYRIGRSEAADRAMDWLEGRQRKSGGFLGSYGRGAGYFPDVEPAWAVKFYLDAHRLRAHSHFEREAGAFPGEISAEDGRSLEIRGLVRPGQKVLEAGCGKGRFLRMLLGAVPGIECTGVDFSPAFLAEAPAGVRRIEGSLESIPCPDDSFDVVFSVEAIEHSLNPEAAIAEMVRVVRPGGFVVVIDKEASQWGRLPCPPWERWPEAERLKQLLSRGCDEVTCDPVGYDGQPADGLMVAWRGRKRIPLTVGAPRRAGAPQVSHEALAAHLRSGRLSPWCQEILLSTAHGERVLEVGSETGEIALALALGGREVTAVIPDRDRIESISAAASALGVSLHIIAGAATGPFSSLGDGEFDCVFSSGLLEHFSAPARRDILRECARVSRGRVIALVPNASCVAYRLGKECQELTGGWPYGHEAPIRSLREDFEAAGLSVLDEHSVGGRHALGFLPAGHILRDALETWLGGRSEDDLREWNQGYLLFTSGTKARPAGEAGAP